MLICRTTALKGLEPFRSLFSKGFSSSDGMFIDSWIEYWIKYTFTHTSCWKDVPLMGIYRTFYIYHLMRNHEDVALKM